MAAPSARSSFCGRTGWSGGIVAIRSHGVWRRAAGAISGGSRPATWAGRAPAAA